MSYKNDKAHALGHLMVACLRPPTRKEIFFSCCVLSSSAVYHGFNAAVASPLG